MNETEYQTLVKEVPAARGRLEFVSGSYRNMPFRRFKRDRNKPLTRAELKHRIAFDEASFGVLGAKGLRDVDGTRMPAGARAVRDQLKGKTFTDLTPSQKRLQSAKMRLGKVRKVEAPKLSQQEVLKQWDYWKKRAERDVRNLKVWRPRVVVHSRP